MAGRMRIGFDFDDVLAQTAERTVQLYNQLYSTRLEVDDWYDFTDMSRWGDERLPKVVARVSDILQSDEFTDTVIDLEEAKVVVSALYDAGHILSIITGRSEQLRQQTVRTAERLFPGIFPTESVYFTDHFATEGGMLTKGEVAKQLELTHYVDDQIVHAEDVAATGTKVVLFGHRKWNASEDISGAVRVDNWRALKEYFESEAR